MTKYMVKGVGEVDLGQKNFLAKGGQGSVFNRGQIAYKIYDDPTKMLSLGKIQELSVLNHPNIIKPENIVLNNKNKIVGYTMKYVNGHVLCQLFTKSFKQRNNVTEKDTLQLVQKFYELVEFVHQKNILVVDLNELNWLVSDNFKEIYAIDTDGYQTKSFPATVIMDNIRDRHCKNNNFTKETDWFSWGILTSQLILGIHPYRGNHPKYTSLPINQRLDARMTDNVSIFNKDAKVPAICPPFDTIPSGLLAWMKAVFEEGKRIKPPKDFEQGIVIVVDIKHITGSDLFNINDYFSSEEEIISYYSHHGDEIFAGHNKIKFENKVYSIPAKNPLFAFSSNNNQPLCVYIDSGKLRVYNIVLQEELNVNINAINLMENNGTIYIQNNTQIFELKFVEFGKNITCVTNTVANVLDIPGATKVFDGVVVQNMLGRYIASYFPQPAHCYQLNIKELDGYKIIDAKYENNVLVVVGITLQGQYDRFVFRLDKSNYDCRKVENILFTGLNFVVNDAGVCVLLNEEEHIEIFSNKINSGKVKEIEDNCISGDMKLYCNGSKILFSKGNKMFSLSMKNTK